MNILKRRFTFVPVLLSTIVGYSAWGNGHQIWLALLFPLLWGATKSRRIATFSALAYYLAGSRVIPSAAGVFFGQESSYVLGLMLWVAAAALNSIPWCICWSQKFTATWWRLPAHLTLALTLSLIPPFALVGWLNPLLASGSIFPSAGFAGISATLILICVLCTLFVTGRRSSLALFVTATVVLGVIGLRTPLKSSLPGWEAINLRAGPFPHTDQEKFIRNRLLIDRTVDAIDRGLQVVIFPEQIAGWWGDLSTNSMINAAINSRPDKSIVVVLGAEVPIPNSKASTNSLVFFQNGALSKLDSRQSVPIALWKPWSDETTPANWMRTNVVEIDGTKALFSFCYEDFIPLLHFFSFYADPPDVIVSVSNAWWVRNTDEVEIQEQHIAAIARIFGVPMLRSVNRG